MKNYSMMKREEVFNEVYHSSNDLAKRVVELYEELEIEMGSVEEEYSNMEDRYHEGYEDARTEAIRALEDI